MINRPVSLAGRGSVTVERCQGAPRRQAAGAQTGWAGRKLVSSAQPLLRWGGDFSRFPRSRLPPTAHSRRMLPAGPCFSATADVACHGSGLRSLPFLPWSMDSHDFCSSLPWLTSSSRGRCLEYWAGPAHLNHLGNGSPPSELLK